MNNFRGEFELKLNGKTYQAKLSMNALRMMCQQDKIDLNDLYDYMSKDPMTSVCSLAFHAIKNKALIEGKDSGLPKFETFCALALDDPDQFEYMSAQVMEQLSPDGDDEESKKA